jgi:RNA polymerase sigma-70 factor (ECF subfamily)
MSDPIDGAPPARTVAVRPHPAILSGSALATDRDLEARIAVVWEAHNRDLHAFAVSLVRDLDTAQDLVAEAYFRLIREHRRGRAPDEPRSWLYRVVANLHLSRGRRLRTAQRFLGRLVERRVEESPEARLARTELSPGLSAALLALKADARVAVVMAARGCSGRDIAAALGRTETSTRTILYRARLELRERLAQGDGS